MTRRTCLRFAPFLALLLACSLLLAQWTGVQHRIAHASLLATGTTMLHAETDLSVDGKSDKTSLHSCILLDAGAVGASLPGCDRMPLLPRIASLPIAALPFVSWQALFVRQFSSRAPPSFG